MSTTTPSIEAEIADLLADLAKVQGELLEHLNEKRELIVKRDDVALAALQAREESLVQELARCHQRRESVLELAKEQGIEAPTILQLSESLEDSSRDKILPSIQEAQERARLLHHQSLTNWVIVQRTLIHLSQMIEIIATGGRAQPTYSKDGKKINSGSLVDHAA